MCLHLTDNEISEIKQNFRQKLLVLGYPLDMDLCCWGVHIHKENKPNMFSITFQYFLLKYVLTVFKSDGVFHLSDEINDLEKTLVQAFQNTSEPISQEVKGQDISNGNPSREEILDYLKSYTPDMSYYDYIENLHIAIRGW